MRYRTNIGTATWTHVSNAQMAQLWSHLLVMREPAADGPETTQQNPVCCAVHVAVSIDKSAASHTASQGSAECSFSHEHTSIRLSGISCTPSGALTFWTFFTPVFPFAISSFYLNVKYERGNYACLSKWVASNCGRQIQKCTYALRKRTLSLLTHYTTHNWSTNRCWCDERRV